MCNIVDIADKRYPQILRQIDNPPQKLYFKGNWDNTLFGNCLTVVGSRRRTTYGKNITNQLVTQIAAAGITIVSGFMYGIDADAHRAAVDAGKRTIAVMPCGVDIIHPSYQKELYKQILENNGLIISELKNSHPPAIWTYPRRNRIMAALSQATLVIEAAEKSGTLITASFAQKYKKKLFAVPGPLNSKTSLGPAKLIKEGAEIVTSSEDILSSYNLRPTQNTEAKTINLNELNSLEQKIIEKLNLEPLEFDALSSSLDVLPAELGRAISLMELKNFLVKEKGKYYLKYQ